MQDEMVQHYSSQMAVALETTKWRTPLPPQSCTQADTRNRNEAFDVVYNPQLPVLTNLAPLTSRDKPNLQFYFYRVLCYS